MLLLFLPCVLHVPPILKIFGRPNIIPLEDPGIFSRTAGQPHNLVGMVSVLLRVEPAIRCVQFAPQKMLT
jgi:hypothetical protein